MKQAKLGATGQEIGRIGLGLMGMSAFYTGAALDDDSSIRTIHRAIELGVTFFDTAEIYGPYINEELLAKAIAGRRDEIVIATKFGTILHRPRTAGVSTAAERMCGSRRRAPFRDLLPTTSICPISTGWIPVCRSRKQSVRCRS